MTLRLEELEAAARKLADVVGQSLGPLEAEVSRVLERSRLLKHGGTVMKRCVVSRQSPNPSLAGHPESVLADP